jgi:hypothetical protein
MSTQRRENGSTPAAKARRRGPRDRWQYRSCTEDAKRSSQIRLAFIAWFARVIATVGTAPLKAIFKMPQARLATNSLQSDHLFAQLAPFVEQGIRRGSPPTGTATRSAGSRSSLPLTPIPSVLASVHPSLLSHPAGKCRWTERYDGKRDLHFQHAA